MDLSFGREFNTGFCQIKLERKNENVSCRTVYPVPGAKKWACAGLPGERFAPESILADNARRLAAPRMQPLRLLIKHANQTVRRREHNYKSRGCSEQPPLRRFHAAQRARSTLVLIIKLEGSPPLLPENRSRSTVDPKTSAGSRLRPLASPADAAVTVV